MKISTLKRKELIELHSKFDCSKWKTNISEILTNNILKGDDDLIEIESKYLTLLTIEGTDEQKKFVEKYGIKQPKSIIDRVKTFEDALNIVTTTEDERWLLGYSGKDNGILAQVASLKLSIIAKVLNEGWIPDWNNSSQYKYYPWFKADGSGSGWVYDGCFGWYSVSGVGSRLTFKTRELAVYSGRQFIDLYSAMFKLS